MIVIEERQVTTDKLIMPGAFFFWLDQSKSGTFVLEIEIEGTIGVMQIVFSFIQKIDTDPSLVVILMAVEWIMLWVAFFDLQTIM